VKRRRRFLAAEVVQTSNMDCGPAALKCLLEGFGVSVSYGRLREACQTDVDGTSIDTIEDVAVRLGLDAEQTMLPVDYVLHPDSSALPAIIVVRLPGGGTHFVVAWRVCGRLIQVMDPAIGRRWLSIEGFLQSVYVHTARVAAPAWREWAASVPALAQIRASLSGLGIDGQPFIETALKDAGWHSLATLEAASRTMRALVRAGALRRGRESVLALKHLIAEPTLIGRVYWSVESVGNGELALRGAVLVHVRGARSVNAEADRLSPELAAALTERPTRPACELWRLIREDGALTPGIVVAGLACAGASVVLEAILLRGLLDVGRDLPVAGQRMAAMAALLSFLVILLLLDARLASLVARLGRQLEIRLRLAFLRKIPRIGDRYFHSRLQSDMAERSHMTHRVRGVPDLAARFVRASCELLFTTAAIAWVDPTAAPLGISAAIAAAAVPLAMQPTITERDLRVRTHTGALSRFYLDALLGLMPIHTHGGERAVRREHGRLLGEWAHAALALQRSAIRVEALQLALVFGFAAWAMLGHASRMPDAGWVLLLVYWLLNLPAIGDDIALVAWQYPSYRNTTLRLLEPLGAMEHLPMDAVHVAAAASQADDCGDAMSVRFEHVNVRAAGHAILNDIDLDIPAGSHVAILGASGAGKSSLAGVLLGWHRPAGGTVLVDEVSLDGCLETVRGQTAWVDPAVHLWNSPLTDNVRYGGSSGDADQLGAAIECAGLWSVIQKLPDGMQTRLGEGGALVSGGEGQRVRLARGMLRSHARLVILDEPFRGLAAAQRRELLEEARRKWRHATLLYITHDIAHTKAFDRVLILEAGRIVEDGSPQSLAARSGSRYCALLNAERSTAQAFWHDGVWRRAHLERGELRFAAGADAYDPHMALVGRGCGD
jgi:ABC-type bacteriocin/lantibiotic exporter with double-glycine peptidase domain